MNGGAVAYLTQSVYGRNKEEITINNYYTNEDEPYNVVLSGLAGSDVSAYPVNVIIDVNAYNTENGMKASSTGNITGIYDLSGGLWEYTSGYILNGNSQLIYTGMNQGTSGILMGADDAANPNGYQNSSTRDYTIYLYESLKDTEIDNYNINKSMLSNVYGYGEAILETSNNGTGITSWYYDYSFFPYTNAPFFGRGNRYTAASDSGLYNFNHTMGFVTCNDGFRAILIAE